MSVTTLFEIFVNDMGWSMASRELEIQKDLYRRNNNKKKLNLVFRYVRENGWDTEFLSVNFLSEKFDAEGGERCLVIRCKSPYKFKKGLDAELKDARLRGARFTTAGKFMGLMNATISTDQDGAQTFFNDNHESNAWYFNTWVDCAYDKAVRYYQRNPIAYDKKIKKPEGFPF